MNNVESLRYFLPESVLTVATLAMLIQDLITRKHANRVRQLTIGALVWLAATRGLTAMEHLHDMAGYAILLTVFAGSILFATWFRRGLRLRDGPDDAASPASASRSGESGYRRARGRCGYHSFHQEQ